MSELLTAGFDYREKWFSSVSTTAIKAAELRLKLPVVTAANIAQGLTPARYIKSTGKLGKAIFISSGLQMGTVASEYLVWREVARSIDDNGLPPDTDAGRWSRHIPDSELESANVVILHEISASSVRIKHRIWAKGFGEVEFDESRRIPNKALPLLAISLHSRRERWCSAFADTLACPALSARATPQLFRLVKFALKIDLSLELEFSSQENP